MTQEQEPIFEQRTFLGKKLVKKGEGKKGPWKLYELEFNSDRKNSKYNMKFKAFDGVGSKSGLTLKDLEEGEDYNIGYQVEDREVEIKGQKKEYQSRTIFWIGEATEESESEEGEDVDEEIETLTISTDSLDKVQEAFDADELTKDELIDVTMSDGSEKEMLVKDILAHAKGKRSF